MMVRTRKAVVVAVGQLIIDKNWMRAVLFLEALLHALDLAVGDLEAGPSVPLEAGCLAKPTQTSDETARRHGKRIAAILGALDSDGQTVGEQ